MTAALIAVTAPLPEGKPTHPPKGSVVKSVTPLPLKPLRPDRPTPAQRIAPGLY